MDLDNRALLYALSKIRWADSKHRLVAYVIANDQGAELGTILSQQAAGEETGISRTLVRKYFAELVDECVLERHDGGGPRGHAYRVNRAFDEWRVPWFGAHPVVDRDWPIKREKAIAQIVLFLCPPEGHKTRSAARPVARLTLTAARSGARLWGATRATGRAAEDPLPARPVARLGIGADAALTIPSSIETIDRSNDEVSKLLAAIAIKANAPCGGPFEQRVRVAVAELELDPIVDRVRNAGDGLRLPALVSFVEQVAAGVRAGVDRAPVSAPAIPTFRREAWEDEESAPPPWVAAGLTHREWAASGAVACETGAGGGS